jgi:hypothetical protein
MFRAILTALLVLFAFVIPAAAQNPCETISATQFMFNPTSMLFTSTDWDAKEADGSDRFSGVMYAAFPQGTTPGNTGMVQGPSTIPRASVTLVAGTTNCYRASLPGLVPVGQPLVVSGKWFRNANPVSGLPAAEGGWADASNPFGSAPAALGKIPRVRVSQ